MATRDPNAGHREAPPQGLYWAKRSFEYGLPRTTERQLDRGQVFKFEHLPNDALLYDLAYCALVQEGAPLYACRTCGGEFIDPGMRDAHGKLRHEVKEFVPSPAPVREHDETRDEYQNRLDEWARREGERSDAHLEEQDKHEDLLAPVDLTKTTASRA